MRALLLGVIFGLFFAGPAFADFLHCGLKQQAALIEAVKGAQLALDIAEVSIGPDNEHFETWFGPFSAKRGEFVRDRLSDIRVEMEIENLDFYCAKNGEQSCERGSYANVSPDAPFLIYICPDYFELPELANVVDIESEEYGTRDGALVHEMTHFDVLAATEDGCYGRSQCAFFAESQPRRAYDNADAYEYFVEDNAFGR